MSRFLLIPFIALFFSSSLLPQGYVCAVGGGSENYGDWSDAPYRWIVQKAGNGKVIVLSVNDETTWIPTYFTSFGASSAVNKKINTRAIADLQATYDEIVSARAVFIKGGDQWNYINYWKGTKTEQAILQVFNSGGVIAGTSAGAMVLGELDFSAQVASPTSKEVLANPFSSSVTFESNFLKLVPGVLFDTHVAERGRAGRAIGMLVKAKQTLSLDMLGVAIDDMTALCVDTAGVGTVMGSGSVSFYYPDAGTRFNLAPPYWYVSRLHGAQLTANWKFDLRARQVVFIPPSARALDTAAAPALPAANIFFTGNNSITPQLQHLPRLLPNPAEGCMVLYNYSFRDSAATLLNYLTAAGYAPASAVISPAAAGSAVVAAGIAAASRFIIAGDSLPAFAPLRDTATLIGRAFALKTVTATAFLAFGNASKLLGGAFADNTDTDGLAGYRGKITVNPGLRAFPGAVLQPLAYDNATYYENRSTALPYIMMRAGQKYGFYSDGTDLAEYRGLHGTLTGTGNLPLYIVDASGATYADSSVYRATSSVGPRQIAALNDLRISLCRFPGYAYSFASREIVVATGIEAESPVSSGAGLFPNPNGGSFTLLVPPGEETTAKLYSITGSLASEGVFPASASGRIEFSARGLPAGVYIIRVTSKTGWFAKKLVIHPFHAY